MGVYAEIFWGREISPKLIDTPTFSLDAELQAVTERHHEGIHILLRHLLEPHLAASLPYFFFM